MKKFNSFKFWSTVPLYVFLIVLVFIPAVFIIIVSFSKGDALGNVTFSFTLENFQKLANPLYGKVILDSLLLAAGTTITTFLISYPLAYFVSKVPKKVQLVLILLIMLPYWTNSLVRTYSFVILLRTEGFINHILMALHLIDQPLKMLYTQGAVVAGMVYILLPVMFLPIFSSIEKLDQSYVEASRDLGAGQVRTFFHVVLPLTVPGIVAGAILVFTPTLGYFFISDLLGGGKVVLLGNLIRDQFTVTRNLPLGSALSVVMMVISFVFIAVYLRIMKKQSQGGRA